MRGTISPPPISLHGVVRNKAHTHLDIHFS